MLGSVEHGCVRPLTICEIQRSFRRTFKVMMRDLGVNEEVHDAITGHGENKTTSRSNYGGGGFKQWFEAIAKLDVSFLGSA